MQNNFSDRVKAIVCSIPAGETMSYREVAEKVGSPRAARAVAQIMAKNYDVTIPCHRVIKSDGTLGGYNRGGEKTKRTLLEKEQQMITQ